jgi:hypothetical protein
MDRRLGIGGAALAVLVMAGCNLGVAPVTYELKDPDDFDLPLGPTGVATGDIDDDGDVDVVATGSNGYAVLTNDGTGALGIDFPGGPPVGGGRPALADIDGDDDLDLLETVTDSTQPGQPVVPALRRNDGTGAFGAIELVGPTPLGGLSGFGAFDADGDGDVDLVASGRFEGDRLVAVFPNDGTGTFGPAAAYPLGYASDEAASGPLEAGDLDGDGDTDLVVTDLRRPPPGQPTASRTIALVALNDGAGGFVATGGPIDVARPGLLAPLDPALADLDEDGTLDLAVGGPASITTLLGDGAGGFGAPRTSPMPDAHPLEFVTPTDIDEDGHVDLVAFDDLFSSEAGLVVYGDGTGGVADSHVVVSGTEIGDDGVMGNDVEIADLDGDGDPDILFVAGNLGVVENNTNGRRPVH